MLSIGSKVFVPNYGAGIVANVEFRKVYDTIYKFIDIKMMIDNMMLFIPFGRVEAYRLREITTQDKLNDALKVITETPENIQKKWGVRYRENNDKIYSGEILKECEVLRDLYYLKRSNIMPPGEQKILDKVESIVASEIMLVLDIELNEAMKIIKDLGRINK